MTVSRTCGRLSPHSSDTAGEKRRDGDAEIRQAWQETDRYSYLMVLKAVDRGWKKVYRHHLYPQRRFPNI